MYATYHTCSMMH